ncbi:hypothetical protein BDN71DRAFT_1505771 [Pleurotus eryngii]|uniref:Uncharacterized protein n=1 Tax=Pleurotus eryngii TaxID=5323 RepID=A0A9P6A1F7_PLEER|nr:hypothetical protein BDN71DRAFT_1505771 [Pleurotus eryngii]
MTAVTPAPSRRRATLQAFTALFQHPGGLHTYIPSEPEKRIFYARCDDANAPVCWIRASLDTRRKLLAVKNVGDWSMILTDNVSSECTTLEALKSEGGIKLDAIRNHMFKGLDILHKECMRVFASMAEWHCV